jgi:hypothetical protein
MSNDTVAKSENFARIELLNRLVMGKKAIFNVICPFFAHTFTAFHTFCSAISNPKI